MPKLSVPAAVFFGMLALGGIAKAQSTGSPPPDSSDQTSPPEPAESAESAPAHADSPASDQIDVSDSESAAKNRPDTCVVKSSTASPPSTDERPWAWDPSLKKKCPPKK